MAKHTTPREKRKARIRRKLSGTNERPRLTVYKSLKHMYAQLVDDINKVTIVAASTVQKDVKTGLKNGGNRSPLDVPDHLRSAPSA